MYEFDAKKYKNELKTILLEIESRDEFDKETFRKILQKTPKDGKGLFSKDQLVRGYEYLIQTSEFDRSTKVESRIQMKPTRTMSGVVPVTVLTKPFHCPGKCIFCPLERNMPKSYLRNEPGCQRAERNNFSPYMQVYNRLLALKNIGHKTEKVELIVLGGTWSYYPVPYQIWFIKELFRALNDFGIVDEGINGFEPKGEEVKNLDKLWDELESEHKKNENAQARSVGLSIETRPDFLNEKETIHLRRLGCTKIQIGVQSMDDKVLELNKRGHDARASIDAANILRKAGFKVQIHYMPNLYGSTPEIDIRGYKKLFEDNSVLPDELKLYPCSIIANTELFDIFKRGGYLPYTEEQLLYVMTECLKATPQYTRLSRVIRDIPSTDIVEGNKKTNFRQIAENELERVNTPVRDIRYREIKNAEFDPEKIELKEIHFETEVSNEIFFQYVTQEDKILGFLRLSLPKNSNEHFIEELRNSALIREIHVYGVSLNINDRTESATQHLGLGTKLIAKAREVAAQKEYQKLAVISAIGTREYYRKKGFEDGELYQSMNIY